MLSEQCEDIMCRGVAYWSKTISLPECTNYIHYKQPLALVQPFQEWKASTKKGQKPVSVLTAHKARHTWMPTKEFSEWQDMWMETLSKYNLKIQYSEGEERGTTGAITRKAGDIPLAGNQRLTRHVQLLLSK